MKEKIRFGPAGKPINFKGKANEACEYIRNEGLSAYEYQSTYGVKIGEEASKVLKKDSIKNDILVSMHGPYYINLCSKKEETIEKSIERLVQSAKVANWMGAYRIVFHPGFYSNQKPDYAMKVAKTAIDNLLEKLDSLGLNDIIFAPETTGKRSQLGNLDEIIDICSNYSNFEPTIDFAHLHARGIGAIKEKEDYNKILSKIESGLDIDILHCHFTKIEYSDAGERKHHILEDNKYGPNLRWLLETMVENDWKATIICETPLIDQDAIKMNELYNEIRN
ncbi:MAG: TIM barrel protein [Methanobacteriaceae archaeon]